jgi:hypothetical protein
VYGEAPTDVNAHAQKPHSQVCYGSIHIPDGSADVSPELPTDTFIAPSLRPMLCNSPQDLWLSPEFIFRRAMYSKRVYNMINTGQQSRSQSGEHKKARSRAKITRAASKRSWAFRARARIGPSARMSTFAA